VLQSLSDSFDAEPGGAQIANRNRFEQADFSDVVAKPSTALFIGADQAAHDPIGES
jgi:hypothetical protein